MPLISPAWAYTSLNDNNNNNNKKKTNIFNSAYAVMI